MLTWYEWIRLVLAIANAFVCLYSAVSSADPSYGKGSQTGRRVLAGYAFAVGAGNLANYGLHPTLGMWLTLAASVTGLVWFAVELRSRCKIGS